jgi:hypothetical protein
MRFWVLGAEDPEMSLIERILSVCAERYTNAMDSYGRVVQQDTAHNAVAVCDELSLAGMRMLGGEIFLVECAVGAGANNNLRALGVDAWEGHSNTAAVVWHIDHHRHGDPGYGRPPSEYLEASSVGRVLLELSRREAFTDYAAHLLGWTRTERPEKPERTSGWNAGALPVAGDRMEWWEPHKEVLRIAAEDHCLEAAYLGKCPGVNPDAILVRRLERRAIELHLNLMSLIAEVELYRTKIRSAPDLVLANGVPPAKDLRESHFPGIEEFKEAYLREGLCVVTKDSHGISCHNGSQEQVDAFVVSWAPSNGLSAGWGSTRGSAFAYRLPKE